MHNLALALDARGYTVTGSDDEIYEPSRSRLAAAGLLPDRMGWDETRIHSGLDAVIVGMHARPDNPELKAAQALRLPIYSYPEYLYQQSQYKRRVVIAGSHGKTTTTGMVMHVLRHQGYDFDYAIGASVDGFDKMVRLTKEAPLMIIEGDEYSASPVDPRPKFAHYRPHIAVLTGIAWDHANIYPTFKKYRKVFKHWVESLDRQSTLIYCRHDAELCEVVEKAASQTIIGYETPDYFIENGVTHLKKIAANGDLLRIPLQVFGEHNLQNIQAAYRVCLELGMSESQFMEAIQSYRGAAGRLQKVAETPVCSVFRDFAHAPSKVAATVRAVRHQYPQRRIFALLELHTFSSLHLDFLPQYAGTLAAANEAWIYYNPHTLEMKRLPSFEPAKLQTMQFHPNARVFTDIEELRTALQKIDLRQTVLLWMSSGNWAGMNVAEWAASAMPRW